jgi:hypothetical protein
MFHLINLVVYSFVLYLYLILSGDVLLKAIQKKKMLLINELYNQRCNSL